MAEINVTTATFQQEVLEADKPVLVDFWAAWCGPCRMLAPIVAKIAETRADIKVCKVNVDEETDLAIRFGVNSIPTVLAFKGGKLVGKSIGYVGEKNLTELIDK